jgi:exodeoxyribonuclease VII large subunit
MSAERELPLFVEREGPAVYTVSELTEGVRAALEGAFDEELAVRGEISNFKHHASRHMYFSLKDDAAVLRCVFFHPANTALRFAAEDGLEVVARGRLGVYPPQGSYQLYVSSLALRGEGGLMAALERLKKKLAAEGLFDEERKRPLPRFPRRVGVVTSPSGAAFRDVKNVLARRWPGITIILRPTRVQGEGAAADVARAIAEFDEAGAADVLIVGRGGGSLEDLWAFNEEAAVRAVAASRTPTISAVGHEVDWTLADFAADLRAPTPSAAAEIAVPVKEAVAAEVAAMRLAAAGAAENYFLQTRDDVAALKRAYGFRAVRRRVDERRQQVDETAARASRAVRGAAAVFRSRYAEAARGFRALSPAATLARGYNVATRDGKAVKRAAAAAAGDDITLNFADGRRAVKVMADGEADGA